MSDERRYDEGRVFRRRVGMALAILGLALAVLWTTGVLAYIVSPAGWRAPIVGAFLLAMVVLTSAPAMRRLVPWIIIGCFVLAWVVFLSRTPSNDRRWVAREARLAWGAVEGDRLVVHNVRNFRFRSTEDFDEDWQTRAYDLGALESVAFVLARFPDLSLGAHTFVSFGFADGEYLALSIEARKEVDEEYGLLPGLFRQFETIYVAGDERDLIGLRSHVLKDEVLLYPMRSTPEGRRAFLLDMMATMNELRTKPSFYNTLMDTCTTGLHRHLQRVQAEPAPIAYEVLVSGLSDRRAYDLGLIDTDLPFEDARRQYRVDASRTTLEAADFSAGIRTGWQGKPWSGGGERLRLGVEGPR